MGKDTKVYVRVDPWIGSGGDYWLPMHIIKHIRSRGIYTLHQILEYDYNLASRVVFYKGFKIKGGR